MATYVIGDIHGCFRTLEKLFAALGFDETEDRLWLVGDLVNRGPGSLPTLRWVKAKSHALGGRFAVVLGNHDLHLMAVDAGLSEQRRRDTLGEILAAPDRRELIDWLAERPLIHRESDTVLVHAGLAPHWSVEEAERQARRCEGVLRSKEGRASLLQRSKLPTLEPETEEYSLAALTRMRTVQADGRLCDFSGAPEDAPVGCRPWFAASGRASRGTRLVAGHWAALGLHVEEGFLGLDTGCVWGGRLTAVRLEDGELFSVENCEA